MAKSIDVEKLIAKRSQPLKSADEIGAERQANYDFLIEARRRDLARRKMRRDLGIFKRPSKAHPRTDMEGKRPAICYLLDRLSMSQQEFAEMSHISGRTINRWCTGERETPRHILVWLKQMEAWFK